MADYANHQATGLLELMQLHSAHLMAMVSHGDEQTELPLLWRICAALSDFGYPVTVLDGTTYENASNPGLSHMLSQEYWPDRRSWSDSSWAVIPAASGLRDLDASTNATEGLQRLAGLFAADSAVIVYAKASALGGLLRSSSVQPVLAAAPVKGSLLTSYLALKQLLSHSSVTPNIVCMSTAPCAEPTLSPEQLVQKLSECAQQYLGLDIHVQMLDTIDHDRAIHPDLQRLVLRMLENAAPLRSKNSYHAANGGQLRTGYFVGGH